MQLYRLNDLSPSPGLDILKSEFSNRVFDESYAENYAWDHRDKLSNIFYLLKNGRYSVGCYFVIENNGKYIASAGWNKYDNETALVLTRAFITEEYRTSYVMGNELLPIMLDESKSFQNIWITCNKNNKAIYDWFTRNKEGKSPAMFSNWPDIYSRFEPIGIRTVYFTEQFVSQLKR